MRHMARVVGVGGGVLLGVDLRKPTDILEAAYNDRDGVTAAFNLNLLTRINRELGADFQPELFEHHAVVNPELSRIEMHLISRVEQCVQVGDVSFHFRDGESIHTENSYKYDLGDLRSRARRCGLRMDRVWTDERHYFAIAFLTAVG